MYKFELPGETRGDPKFVPLDNLLIRNPYTEMFEGIETHVPGYMQLSVSGRGLVSEQVKTIDVPRRSGLYYSYIQTEPRVITVRYMIEAESSEGLRMSFDQLNEVLRWQIQDDFSPYPSLHILFADDLDWSYYAVLENAGDIAEDRLSLIGSFDLVCPDPYKYGRIMNSTSISMRGQGPILPSKIELTLDQPQTSVEVFSNYPFGGETGDSIKLVGNYSAGDLIQIWWGDTGITVTKNYASNITNDLARFSYPESFWLYNNFTVDAIGARVTRMEWRDKRL